MNIRSPLAFPWLAVSCSPPVAYPRIDSSKIVVCSWPAGVPIEADPRFIARRDARPRVPACIVSREDPTFTVQAVHIGLWTCFLEVVERSEALVDRRREGRSIAKTNDAMPGHVKTTVVASVLSCSPAVEAIKGMMRRREKGLSPTVVPRRAMVVRRQGSSSTE